MELGPAALFLPLFAPNSRNLLASPRQTPGWYTNRCKTESRHRNLLHAHFSRHHHRHYHWSSFFLLDTKRLAAVTLNLNPNLWVRERENTFKSKTKHPTTQQQSARGLKKKKMAARRQQTRTGDWKQKAESSTDTTTTNEIKTLK
jgi:hypothetical protein